jgi:hypothetical protein
MANDILTQLQKDIAFRLRLQAKVSNFYVFDHPHMVRVPTIYEEAADEIEQLRKELDQYKRLLQTELDICDYNDPCEMCKQKLDEAMSQVFD